MDTGWSCGCHTYGGKHGAPDLSNNCADYPDCRDTRTRVALGTARSIHIEKRKEERLKAPDWAWRLAGDDWHVDYEESTDRSE